VKPRTAGNKFSHRDNHRLLGETNFRILVLDLQRQGQAWRSRWVRVFAGA
jgi:hypothetical protein